MASQSGSKMQNICHLLEFLHKYASAWQLLWITTSHGYIIKTLKIKSPFNHNWRKCTSAIRFMKIIWLFE